MTRTQRRLLGLMAWTAPLAWAIPWALFRGENAHGGYVWWGQVHNGGLTILLLAAISLRAYLWRTRGTSGDRSFGMHLAGQVALVGVTVIVSWLSFQTGMAMHDPPESVSQFLWGEP